MRLFGHSDTQGPDHAGPEARWAKQARRQIKRAERAISNPRHKDDGAVKTAARERLARLKAAA